MTNVTAVYENGVFRPTVPVELAEGQIVELMFTPLPSPQAEEQALIDRLNAAESLQEALAVMASASPELDLEYEELMREMQERRAHGRAWDATTPNGRGT